MQLPTLWAVGSHHNTTCGYSPDEGYLDAWKALEKLQREGVAKSIGVSNFGVLHIDAVLDKGDVVPAMNQVGKQRAVCYGLWHVA